MFVNFVYLEERLDIVDAILNDTELLQELQVLMLA